jgi:hypothetical protein
MNVFAYFPSRPHWTSEQLADAVPQRLRALFAFDAGRVDSAGAAANHEGRRLRRDASYARGSALPARFQVR